MAKSKKSGPEGLIPYRLPSLTPGPLGHNDAGHPDTPRWLFGDTPGTLGLRDHADPEPLRPSSLLPQAGQLRLDPLLESLYWSLSPFVLSKLVFVTEADEAEFNLFKAKGTLKITDNNVAEYVKHRTEFFGSTAAYEAYAAESDKEHGEAKYTINQIELEGEAEKVFYRWVRKAYQNEGVNNIPEMIRAGQSERLKQELGKVRVAYGKKFHSGGFNPRPKKINGKYRLGTISEHAMGMAVDIEDKKNPQFNVNQWKFIEKLAGKTVDLNLSRWQQKPKELWTDIKSLNDLFVAKVRAEVKRIEDERTKRAGGVDAHKTPQKAQSDPLKEVFKGQPDLKEWADGFFTLEWPLLEQLHAHNFVWGVTFYNPTKNKGNIDLHHFELR